MSTQRDTMTAGRIWAYIGAGLGSAASIAANVAHSFIPPTGSPAGWSPEVGAVIGSVFWPVAVLVALEILTRVPWPITVRWVLVRWAGLLPVALVAAIVSYRHLSGLMLHWDSTDTLSAMIGPLAVDGLMLLASGALLVKLPVTPPAAPEVTADPAPEVASVEVVTPYVTPAPALPTFALASSVTPGLTSTLSVPDPADPVTAWLIEHWDTRSPLTKDVKAQCAEVTGMSDETIKRRAADLKRATLGSMA